MRIADYMVSQEITDNPMDESPNPREINAMSQVDTSWVQALVAQEMMKWMKGKLAVESHSDGSQSIFAYFTSINSLSSDSSICCSLLNNCFSS